MGLLGTSWDDPKTAAIMGLASGLLQGNVGAGLQMGLQGHQRQSQLNRENTRQEARDVCHQIQRDFDLDALLGPPF